MTNLDGVTPFLTQWTGIRMGYNGCTNFTVENYQGERECNNDIIIMTKGVPYVGTPVVDKKLYDILQEGIMAYFLGECMTNTMIGWDNILLRKFTKQWKIQQRAYVNRKRPCGIQHSMQEN